uniref:ATP synthase F0 subunit 8 n=1 Tax=Panagrolaimus sp. JU765 TaxID=591449 RepID=A0AC34QLD5_9BILA
MNGWWFFFFFVVPCIFIILMIYSLCFRTLYFYPFWRKRRPDTSQPTPPYPVYPIYSVPATGANPVYTQEAPPPYSFNPNHDPRQVSFVSQSLHSVPEKQFY